MTPGSERDDARLIERVREAWSPAPPTPARRAAFDAALEARLERARRRPGPWPALALGAAAAALVALLVTARSEAPPPAARAPLAQKDPAPGETALRAADLLYAGGAGTAELETDDAGLPAEYAAIADLFLDP